jgi:hypothetical protein
MFKQELINGVANLLPIDRDTELKRDIAVVKAFADLYQALRDPNSIKSTAINDLITFINPYLIQRRVLFHVKGFTLSEQLKPHAYNNLPTNKYPVICLPNNYQQLVDEDPIQQLGNVANVLSRCKDFILQTILVEHVFDAIDARAAAYESDVFLTLKKCANRKAESITFNQSQFELMKKYPNGYIGLDGSFKYELTPMYKPPVQ